MAAPALSKEVVDQFASREWRLNNLYWIEDAYGAVVKFKLNQAQSRLLNELHFLNIVLKARQMGFSTFILILALDCCIWNDHFAAGLIADTIDNAKNLLKRVKFAYERMPPQIKGIVGLPTDNALEMEFSNGSSISVGVSLRSGTFNFIHISEYGKICAKAPDKAKEIKSGALNTLAPKQLAFIESTAEGKGGDFYDKTKEARKIIDTKRDPGDLEYKFHFFPWFEDPKYVSTKPVSLTAENIAYFTKLMNEHGITLTEHQMWWYAAKRIEQGDDMLKEFPSTPDEAFEGALDGAYWAKEIRSLRQRGKIGLVPYVPGIPVDTFWDFGLGDAQTIWMHQLVGGEHHFIGYYENSGEGLGHYFDWLNKWRVQRGATWGRHFAPHDVEHKRQGIVAKTIKQIASEVGWEFEVVTRSPDKHHSIMQARNVLPTCLFDEQECSLGIDRLETYCREWDDKYFVWKSQPRHDQASHGADAFMTFTDGYSPPSTVGMPQIAGDWIS